MYYKIHLKSLFAIQKLFLSRKFYTSQSPRFHLVIFLTDMKKIYFKDEPHVTHNAYIIVTFLMLKREQMTKYKKSIKILSNNLRLIYNDIVMQLLLMDVLFIINDFNKCWLT